MGKSTISMAMFNGYVCLPEGTYIQGIWMCFWGETSITDYQCRMLGETASRDSSPKK